MSEKAEFRFEIGADGVSRHIVSAEQFEVPTGATPPFIDMSKVEAGPTRYIFDASKFEIVEGESGFITIAEKGN